MAQDGVPSTLAQWSHFFGSVTKFPPLWFCDDVPSILTQWRSSHLSGSVTEFPLIWISDRVPASLDQWQSSRFSRSLTKLFPLLWVSDRVPASLDQWQRYNSLHRSVTEFPLLWISDRGIIPYTDQWQSPLQFCPVIDSDIFYCDSLTNGYCTTALWLDVPFNLLPSNQDSSLLGMMKNGSSNVTLKMSPKWALFSQNPTGPHCYIFVFNFIEMPLNVIDYKHYF